MKTLVLIPARAGSKGIKNKNLKKLGQKTLVEHTFLTACKLKKIDDIILSTDSKQIIRISKKYKKIKTLFVRPKKFAADNSKMSEVALHSINFLKKINKKFKYIIILQPTTPFRSIKELNKIINYVKKNKIKSLFSVTESWQHPSEFIQIKKGKKAKFLDKNLDTYRQKYKNYYFISGAIYMTEIDYFLKKKRFITNESLPFIMSQETLIDIDNDFHLKVARGLYKS
tara:strand:+ start:450 stop:1130 length:681 start_codon:yes stop_codon:yes gene_type:complete